MDNLNKFIKVWFKTLKQLLTILLPFVVFAGGLHFLEGNPILMVLWGLFCTVTILAYIDIALGSLVRK